MSATNHGRPRIGIDLGGTKIEGIRLEADDTVAQRVRIGTPKNDYPGTVASIVELVRKLDPAGALKVGVGAPGAWVPGRETMQNCNSVWLNGRPLLGDLQRELGPRVRLANDADCFALSEASSGSAVGHGVVFGVILGTGVGGGLVVDGKLLAGPNGLAGEWGHTPLPYLEAPFASRTCYCGRLNCVETFLSGPGLHGTHRELWPDEIDPPATAADVYRRVDFSEPGHAWLDRGSAAAETATTAAARAGVSLSVYCGMLARSLAQMVNIFDPHAIVLGGGLSQMQEIYEPVRTLMAGFIFGEVFETRLLAPRWGDASGVRGAAWLWD